MKSTFGNSFQGSGVARLRAHLTPEHAHLRFILPYPPRATIGPEA